MSIILFDDCGNEITEEIADITGVLDMERIKEAARGFAEAFAEVAEAFKAMIRKVKEAFAQLAARTPDIDDERASETQERRCASILAAQKAAARAKAYGLRMLLEKARRALKRRKRLHNDGGLPDKERQAIR